MGRRKGFDIGGPSISQSSGNTFDHRVTFNFNFQPTNIVSSEQSIIGGLNKAGSGKGRGVMGGTIIKAGVFSFLIKVQNTMSATF